MSSDLSSIDGQNVGPAIDNFRPKKKIPHELLNARINAAAHGLNSEGDYSGTFAERREHLRLIVESEEPESDSVLQLLLNKEIASAKYIEYLRRSSEFNETATMQAYYLGTALKFAKLQLQYQAEYEKTQRKGIQRIILQNNAPVGAQTVFGDVGGQSEPHTIESTAVPSGPTNEPAVRVRKR